jgi:metal-dependent amidase/aminoacylase/carboxypeptidase family protein
MKSFLVLGAALVATPAAGETVRDAVATDMPSLMAIYRELHANPELSFEEVKSAARMAAEVRKLGFEVTTGVGGHGVVAVMRNGPGPTLLIRADMDGLPLTEQTGLPFASKVKAIGAGGIATGVMHACGHDTHMTAWIGAARRLAAMKSHWSGTLVMIGQPAEERVAGAKKMLDDGLFTRFPKPDTVIAFHDTSGLPAGVIGYTDGPALANVDGIDIKVRGVGGHGAVPQLTRDPIVLGCPHRHLAPDACFARDQPVRYGCGNGRQLSCGIEAQHHFERSQPSTHRADLHARKSARICSKASRGSREAKR